MSQRDLDAVALEFGVDERAEFGIDGGENLGELLDLGDGEAAGGEAFGHLEADVTGADDHGSLDAGRSRVRISAKVSPIECSRCTPSSGPR